MKQRTVCLLLAAVMLLGVTGAAGAAEENGKTWYVYTENGKDLNVRLEPNGEIIGRIASGEEVQVLSFLDDTWAEILFHYNHPEQGEGEWKACASRRYLTDIAPEQLKEAMAAEQNAYTGDPLLDINAEFASAEDVEPYLIMIRPPRATSWANMRWIPSETGMIIAQYKATEELTVIKEMTHYLQVQDPDTGDVGFIHRRYAAR